MSFSPDDDLYTISERSALKPDQILNFSVPINPLGFSRKVDKKLKTNLGVVLRHPDFYCRDFIRTLVQYHGVGKDQILAGAGATEFIYAAPRILQLRRALIVTPARDDYERALEAADPGGECRIDYFETREEDGFEMDANGLISSLTLGYDALYLSNPGWPTGILTGKEDLLRILAQTERQKVWFILDETSIDFIEENSLKEMTKSHSRLVLLRSLAKFLALPGLRVGYMISHPDVIRKFRQSKEPRTVNALGQIAASEALQDKGLIRRTREWMPRERGRLIQGLRSVPGFVPYPGAANYFLVQLLPFLGFTAGGLRENLLPKGFLIRDCQSFQTLGPDFLQIAVRTRKENNLLLKALRQIVQSLPAADEPPQSA